MYEVSMLVSTSGMVETPRLPVEVKVWRDVAKPRSPSESLFQTPRLRVEGRLVFMQVDQRTSRMLSRCAP
jgi:hypothetical protein